LNCVMPIIMLHAIINTSHAAITQGIHIKIIFALRLTGPALLMMDIASNMVRIPQNAPSAIVLRQTVKTFSARMSMMIVVILPQLFFIQAYLTVPL